jgi:hypothetical protein
MPAVPAIGRMWVIAEVTVDEGAILRREYGF